MKYKIQTRSVNGWADLKQTLDDGQTYIDEHFDTIHEALDGAAASREFTKASYRVVPASTPQDDDLY